MYVESKILESPVLYSNLMCMVTMIVSSHKPASNILIESNQEIPTFAREDPVGIGDLSVGNSVSIFSKGQDNLGALARKLERLASVQ
jgi:hypothetical protein